MFAVSIDIQPDVNRIQLQTISWNATCYWITAYYSINVWGMPSLPYIHGKDIFKMFWGGSCSFPRIFTILIQI